MEGPLRKATIGSPGGDFHTAAARGIELYPENDSDARAWYAAFQEALQKRGWMEGRNIHIDIRWVTPDDTESMRRLAKELVAPQPNVILSSTTPTTTALLQQTRTIPIVFAIIADPIGRGFVASFARPGGNVTGFIFTEPTMAGKWLELLKQIAPHIDRVAMLYNPVSAPYADYWLNPFKAAAPAFAVEPIAAPELEPVIAAQAREPNGGLITMPDSFTDSHRVEITSLAARYRLPAVYPSVSSLNWVACCPTASIGPTIFGVRPSIAFSRARSQPTFQYKGQRSTKR